MTAKLYGLAAEFLRPEDIVAAAHNAYVKGYRKMDAYTPYCVDGLAKELGQHKTAVPLTCLICGLTGGVTGYGMQWYSAVIDFPLNIGGRPLHSWPAFVPITFELTILFAALGTVLGMLAMNGLPRLNHPIFDTPHFETRNQSRFYLCIETADKRFQLEEVRAFLEEQKPEHLWEVPA